MNFNPFGFEKINEDFSLNLQSTDLQKIILEDEVLSNTSETSSDHFAQMWTDQIMESDYDWALASEADLGEWDDHFGDEIYGNDVVMENIAVRSIKLERKCFRFQQLLNKAFGGGVDESGKPEHVPEFKVMKAQRKNNILFQRVVWRIKDGQTISGVFQVMGETTGTKIRPQDEMVTFQWKVNGKDVTRFIFPSLKKRYNLKQLALALKGMVDANAQSFAARQEEVQQLDLDLELLTGEMEKLGKIDDDANHQTTKLKEDIDTLKASIASLEEEVERLEEEHRMKEVESQMQPELRAHLDKIAPTDEIDIDTQAEVTANAEADKENPNPNPNVNKVIKLIKDVRTLEEECEIIRKYFAGSPKLIGTKKSAHGEKKTLNDWALEVMKHPNFEDYFGEIEGVYGTPRGSRYAAATMAYDLTVRKSSTSRFNMLREKEAELQEAQADLAKESGDDRANGFAELSRLGKILAGYDGAQIEIVHGESDYKPFVLRVNNHESSLQATLQTEDGDSYLIENDSSGLRLYSGDQTGSKISLSNGISSESPKEAILDGIEQAAEILRMLNTAGPHHKSNLNFGVAGAAKLPEEVYQNAIDVFAEEFGANSDMEVLVSGAQSMINRKSSLGSLEGFSRYVLREVLEDDHPKREEFRQAILKALPKGSSIPRAVGDGEGMNDLSSGRTMAGSEVPDVEVGQTLSAEDIEKLEQSTSDKFWDQQKTVVQNNKEAKVQSLLDISSVSDFEEMLQSSEMADVVADPAFADKITQRYIELTNADVAKALAS